MMLHEVKCLHVTEAQNMKWNFISPSSVHSFTCNIFYTKPTVQNIHYFCPASDHYYWWKMIMHIWRCVFDYYVQLANTKLKPDTHVQEVFYWCDINTIKYCRFCISRQTFSIKKSAFYTQILLHRVNAIALYDKNPISRYIVQYTNRK